MTDIRTELSKFPRNEINQRKRKYFHWRNKLDTSRTYYSEMTKEEFKDSLKITDTQWNFLEMWEESDRYKELMYVLHRDNFDADILDVYNAIKDEAMKGNSTAVKTMIDMQKEINKRLNDFNKDEVKDDGLKLNI